MKINKNIILDANYKKKKLKLKMIKCIQQNLIEKTIAI